MGQWHRQMLQSVLQLPEAFVSWTAPPGLQLQSQGGIAPSACHAVEFHHQGVDVAMALQQLSAGVAQLFQAVAKHGAARMGQSQLRKHLGSSGFAAQLGQACRCAFELQVQQLSEGHLRWRHGITGQPCSRPELLAQLLQQARSCQQFVGEWLWSTVVETQRLEPFPQPGWRHCRDQLEHGFDAALADGGGCHQHQPVTWMKQMPQLHQMPLRPAVQSIDAGQCAWIGAVGGHQQQIGAGIELPHGEGREALRSA